MKKEFEKATYSATDVKERLIDDGFYFPSPVFLALFLMKNKVKRTGEQL